MLLSKCKNAEWHYAECPNAQRHYGECRGAKKVFFEQTETREEEDCFRVFFAARNLFSKKKKLFFRLNVE
jgi:hypothetical protein